MAINYVLRLSALYGWCAVWLRCGAVWRGCLWAVVWGPDGYRWIVLSDWESQCSTGSSLPKFASMCRHPKRRASIARICSFAQPSRTPSTSSTSEPVSNPSQFRECLNSNLNGNFKHTLNWHISLFSAATLRRRKVINFSIMITNYDRKSCFGAPTSHFPFAECVIALLVVRSYSFFGETIHWDPTASFFAGKSFRESLTVRFLATFQVRRANETDRMMLLNFRL